MDNFAEQFTVVNPDSFGEGFNVSKFLAGLFKDVLQPAAQARHGPAGRGSVDKIGKLQKTLARADEELTLLNNRDTNRYNILKGQVTKDEGLYQEHVENIEKGMVRIKDRFKEVEQRMVKVSQTATRIGDRLQTADTIRTRALEAVILIGFLQLFSTLPEGSDFSELPDFFTDDESLADAAAVSRRLLALAAEVQAAKQRSKLVVEDAGLGAPMLSLSAAIPTPFLGGAVPVGAHSSTSARPPVGSVEYSMVMLEEYCNWLENRVVQLFDEAVDQRDVEDMAACVHVMAEFDREKTIIQRWVQTRPVFLNMSEADEMAPGFALSAASIAARMKPLQALFRELLNTVKEELGNVKVIFPSPKLAMDVLLQRVFEDRIQNALERYLQPPPPHSDAATLQAYLRLMSEAFQRTLEFAAEIELLSEGLAELGTIGDALFATFLSDYPDLELRWLRTRAEEEMQVQESAEISRAFVAQLLSWHKEAAERVAVLSPLALVPAHVRRLFVSHDDVDSGGCLLEQLTRHLITGIDYSMELCAGTAPVAVTSTAVLGLGFNTVTRSSSAALAQQWVNTKLRQVLVACSSVSSVMTLLQAHYCAVVLVAVAGSVAEHSACNTALVAVLRASEEGATLALRQAVDDLFVQIDRTLSVEQKRGDFLVPSTTTASFDRPTNACMLVAALLEATAGLAKECLGTANLSAFLTEVAMRLHSVLQLHMSRWLFSATGALRWKNDLSHYLDAVQDWDAGLALDKLTHLQAVVNVLVVAPESLVGLVSALRISHAEALKYIALREDFRTAKVDGQTLMQVFAGETAADIMPTFKK